MPCDIADASAREIVASMCDAEQMKALLAVDAECLVVQRIYLGVPCA